MRPGDLLELAFGNLRRIKLFSTMDHQQLESLLHYMELVKIPKFAVLFKKGESADSMFYILEGEIRARKMMEGNETTLFTWQAGEAKPSKEIHVGLAISLRGGGLVAPALRNTNEGSLVELMARMTDLVSRARAGTLRSSEITSATITLTSLGERGVEGVTPIIFPPQVAIVGCGATVERPWVVDGEVVARPAMRVTLGADHRVSNGHQGARFLRTLDRLLQEPEKL